MPFVDLREFVADPEPIAAVPESLARRHNVVPLAVDGRRLIVAINQPGNLAVTEALRFQTHKTIELAIAAQNDIAQAITSWYGEEDVKRAMEQLDARGAVDHSAGRNATKDEEDVLSTGRHLERPVVTLVHNLISDAIRQRASDVHLRPQERHVDVMFRVDGRLSRVRRFSRSLLPAVVGRIKVLGNMNIAEHRLPQDGRARVSQDKRDIDLRISVIPCVYGESVVVRVLDASMALGRLVDLGFNLDDERRMRHLLSRNNGIFLVTGPTGSGKSTTLYTALGEVRQRDMNIITVEDPVEYRLDDIIQIQINPKADYTFARALRHILRHDPDVVMVGEIRDPETAKIAVESALTGHLVMSTLHTNDASSAVARLLEIGIEPYLLKSALLAVLAQRLVRVNCASCTSPESVEDSVRAVMGVGSDEVFQVGVGCAECQGTGVKGRMATYELLEVTPAIRTAINRDATASDIAKLAEGDGMTPLTQHALSLARAGTISLGEAYRVRLT